MISYWKTQWFNLAMSVFYLGIAIVHFCAGESLWGVSWTITAVIWFLMSFINYNEDRIELLEKKAEKYDAFCELVEELRKANEVDRDIDKQQNQRIRLLEEKIR